ncbi:MAG TPA: bifunctional diaminohydroxyphosphoribosylaminopyrimidine deaminase/5-amino-6-(5-phosphoribosylamino)uracil reductase RibD [Methylocella sp.]|nr:bifunctional diaminohydroxyphosphoribosylaminopyrimidine deaminase/5-amino-6-(5-phosphoribosylamino)uracil reductase RibD [Methylocella sp.]
MSGVETHERFMAAALALGSRGLGLCAPNPSVGALIVQDGVIVARGWTRAGGRPHAETEALREAGPQAQGATLYVSLEPCAHHGQTPPCIDAIRAAKVRRVVYAMDDPDPRTGGRAKEILAEAGIEVLADVLAKEAQRQHLGHRLRVTLGRPMVTLKLALTADGYAARLPHEPRLTITGREATTRVHMMRGMHDAIMVGIGTALADDPLLTVRLPGLELRKPLRIILDSNLRLPLVSRLAATAAEHPTLIIAGLGASEANAARLQKSHIDVAFVSRDAAGHIDLKKALRLLGRLGLTRVFCEGGPRLAALLVTQRFADEVIILSGPEKLEQPGISGLSDEAARHLADPSLYRLAESRAVGNCRLLRHERVL